MRDFAGREPRLFRCSGIEGGYFRLRAGHNWLT
jgi:hypothetical protein